MSLIPLKMSKMDLRTVVDRINDRDESIQKNALMILKDIVFKMDDFNGEVMQELNTVKEELLELLKVLSGDERRYFCDILSVVYMFEDDGRILDYRIEGNIIPLEEINHQYVKRLTECIVNRSNSSEMYEMLFPGIVRFLAGHNSETEAIDFLLEVSDIEKIGGNGTDVRIFENVINEESESVKGISENQDTKRHGRNYLELICNEIDDNNRRRIWRYLEGMSKFYRIDDILLRLSVDEPTRHLVLLLKSLRPLDNVEHVINYVCGLRDADMRKQCCYILARCNVYAITDYILRNPDRLSFFSEELKNKSISSSEGSNDKSESVKNSIHSDKKIKISFDEKTVTHILENKHVKEFYTDVAESLEILMSKKLDYMFKGLNADKVDAAAAANALVHFGYCRDPVFFPGKGDFRVKDEYLKQLRSDNNIATVASIGMINAFDPSATIECLGQRVHDAPGAMLAYAISAYKTGDRERNIIGLITAGLQSDSMGQLGNAEGVLGMLAGLAVVYAGTNDQTVYATVFPMLSSTNHNIALFAIYVLGVVFPGDMEILNSVIEIFAELKKENSMFVNYAILGLALFFYKQEIDINLIKSALNEENNSDFIESQYSSSKDKEKLKLAKMFASLDCHSRILALGFAYIGTGNSLVIDHIFAFTLVGKIDALMESLGFIAASLIGIGDDIAQELINRICSSALLLDSPYLRNLIPLCIAILYPSNPNPDVIDNLERQINSSDVNINSIIALGIVAAGSCSARVLSVLAQNFNTSYKDPKASSALLYAQGLVNLGKGLCTLSPLAYKKNIILPRSIIGLISTLFLFLEPGMFKDYPFLFYLIVNAVNPKYVTGFTGTVRVGKPVDVTGLVGSPNEMSAVVVHSLPVVLNENECAETEDLVCTCYIEDILVKRQK